MATKQQTTPTNGSQEPQVPVGGTILAEGDILYNEHKAERTITVCNTGDRPIQVGSHYHFFEVNRLLEFDREAAFGHHLNIPSNTAVRFEPGDKKSVTLVPYGGKGRAIGFGGLAQGATLGKSTSAYCPALAKAMSRVYKRGYKTLKNNK
jgi:urease subunit beta